MDHNELFDKLNDLNFDDVESVKEFAESLTEDQYEAVKAYNQVQLVNLAPKQQMDALLEAMFHALASSEDFSNQTLPLLVSNPTTLDNMIQTVIIFNEMVHTSDPYFAARVIVSLYMTYLQVKGLVAKGYLDDDILPEEFGQ